MKIPNKSPDSPFALGASAATRAIAKVRYANFIIVFMCYVVSAFAAKASQLHVSIRSAFVFIVFILFFCKRESLP